MSTMLREENPIEVIRARLRQRSLRATQTCIAVLGWLCDEVVDEPRITAIRLTPEGHMWARYSNQAGIEDLGLFLEFLQQMDIVCRALSFSEGQTQVVLATVRHRLA